MARPRNRSVSLGALIRILAGAAIVALAVGACAGDPSPRATGPTGTDPGSDTSATAPPMTGGGLRYVALGDSYTIGTSVAIEERWPDQLVRALGATAPTLDLVANLAVNGYTSRDVIDVELPQLAALEPEFVSLLIGVNDVVQGVPETTYRQNLDRIFDDLVGRVGAERILVVTTPDYTVTPAGGDYGDPATQAAAIRAFNAALTSIATARGIVVVDIHDISLGAATDPSLVARDGLHPSGAQYARWVERILPVIAEALGR